MGVGTENIISENYPERAGTSGIQDQDAKITISKNYLKRAGTSGIQDQDAKITIFKNYLKRAGTSGIQDQDAKITISKNYLKRAGTSRIQDQDAKITISKNYPKRAGTSGIQGHLYETKLLSLIYFRALHDDNIKEFHLATNVDKLGSFDDICFRVKGKGIEKPLTVFIQAKHRENNTVLTIDNKSDLIKHYNSYLEIRKNFELVNKDMLFDNRFSDTECVFVIYTTAKGNQSAGKYKSNSAAFLNALIGTEVRGSGLQLLDDSKHAELYQMLLEEEMTALARLMAKYMHGEIKDIQTLNVEDVMLRYHVVLARQVFEVSNQKSGGLRDARLRQDFFDTNEDNVKLFKEKLCTEILKRREFLSGSSPRLRSYLVCCGITHIDNDFEEIKHLITYENRRFEFVDKIGSARYKPYLDKINESQKEKQKTLKMAVKQSLPSLTFKVPAWFGNKDLMIRDNKIERKLKNLTHRISELILLSRPSNIVILNESFEIGFLQLNGGIASAVGNLLVLDEDSRLLKFNDNRESLGKLAKKLFDQLNSEIENLYEIKFDVRVKIFPKLSFDADEYTKNVIRDFLNKLVFYTSQAKEAKVETMLINEIERKLRHRQDIYLNAINAISNTLFIKYHDAIQKWWMKKEGEYLTKDSSLYKNAETNVLSQPLTNFINMMQIINNKNYTFTEDVIKSIKLDDQPSGTVILTKNIRLTVAKLVNHLIKNDCVVLDMQYILNLSACDVNTLQTELIDLNKENTLIVACDKAIFGTRSTEKEIANITKFLKNDTIIVILNDQDCVENVKKYFTLKDIVLKDERNNFNDMSKESQKSILENTFVIFQGIEVNLDQVLDDKSLELVGERVLNKLMQRDICIIGKPVCHLNSQEATYIERSVKCLKVNDSKVDEGETKTISTLHDLNDNVVLVIGDPGMGKSTLLTLLSLTTKQLKQKDWILRVNLLEHSKKLCIWQDNGTVIDTLTSLKFLCQAAISKDLNKRNSVKITLEDRNGTVFLKDCDADEWTIFQLKLFLHYYNTKLLIILFDGFDEISPIYAREAFNLIKTVMNLPRTHKIWITSRSHEKIITELNLQFLYKLEPLTYDKQDLFLSTFWKEKGLLEKFNQERVYNNILEFVRFMSKSDDLHMFKKKSHLTDESISDKPMFAVYLSLIKYLRPKLSYLASRDLHKVSASEFSELVATPLHLNMLAEHLYNQIDVKNPDDDHRDLTRKIIKAEKDKQALSRSVASDSPMSSIWNILSSNDEMEESYNLDAWDLGVNLFEVYEGFLDYKLKIRLEKNDTDNYRPDNREQYKKAHKENKEKLRKLAAYVVFNKRLLDEHDLKHCEEVIAKLKDGEENTDIICNVVNDIPIFVHSTFAEYFAVEYICHQLTESQRNVKMLYNFILNVMFFELNKNILVILDAKIKADMNLSCNIEKNKDVVFSILIEQGKIAKHRGGSIKSSLSEAIRLGLRNLASLLLLTVEKCLDECNLMDFIDIVKETNMLMTAVKMGFDDLIITIIYKVKTISQSKLNVLLDNIEIFNKHDNLAEHSNTELVQKLHANVWTRMDIVPDWENLRGLGGEIYFI